MENQKLDSKSYYERKYWIGSYLSQKRNATVLKFLKGHVVDLGCGDGQLIKAYKGKSTGKFEELITELVK